MKTVVVAMSGGVDSSVSALLLKKQGYNVIGATFKLLDNEASKKSIIDSQIVCESLKIKHYIFDFSKDFKDIVINDFINNYKNCLTPNPCVVCNKSIKFNRFYIEAKKLNADYIATGHYAKIINNKLAKSNDILKDQTYFLWAINKDVLNHIIFPLENFTDKDDVRKIAKENNLIVAEKKDSQDVCFIEHDYTEFLEKNMDVLPDKGDIVYKGKVLGKHKGLFYYTIGQRKGLNISYKNPLYVIGFDKSKNQLLVGDNDDLFNDKLIATNINLLVDELPENVYAKIRSRSKEAKAHLKYINDDILVTFDEKQRAITKGQSVVFYNNGICLGGGIIKDIV